MAATVTLSTTTLQTQAGSSDGSIRVASSSGLAPNTRIYADRELMAVVSLGSSDNVGTWVNVRRGVDGTAGCPHAAGITLTIGTADQFYFVDPVGRPTDEILVAPYINALSGEVWQAQGDPILGGSRWWQKVTTTYGTGSTGQRQTVLDPTSST